MEENKFLFKDLMIMLMILSGDCTKNKVILI